MLAFSRVVTAPIAYARVAVTALFVQPDEVAGGVELLGLVLSLLI